MKLFIEKGSKIDDIKNIFAMQYPYLKIEFYKKQATDQPYPRKDMMLSTQCININNKVAIDITNNITVSELASQFIDVGLFAEVFRRSGNVWIETSLTNNWTLHQQNIEGEEISRHFSEKKNSLPKS